MHYADGAEWRPLFEGDSLLLQVASGCSHSSCAFCDMYKHEFAISPIEEVEQDIQELATRFPEFKGRVFLSGGNSFCLPTLQMLKVLNAIMSAMPEVSGVGAFARITDIAAKTDAEIKELRDAGLNLISIGAESGLDEALKAMEKGFSSADIIAQCARLDDANMEYALFYLAGIAGAGRGIENARITAEIFGKVNPRIIMVHTMTPFDGTTLKDMIDTGDFAPAPEKEIQKELREFYALYPKKTTIMAHHISNTVAFVGNIPEERDEILELMNSRIALDDESTLAERRRHMTSI